VPEGPTEVLAGLPEKFRAVVKEQLAAARKSGFEDARAAFKRHTPSAGQEPAPVEQAPASSNAFPSPEQAAITAFHRIAGDPTYGQNAGMSEAEKFVRENTVKALWGEPTRYGPRRRDPHLPMPAPRSEPAPARPKSEAEPIPLLKVAQEEGKRK
jgi:hypothetical protein